MAMVEIIVIAILIRHHVSKSEKGHSMDHILLPHLYKGRDLMVASCEDAQGR